jgi:hypothetical protein
MCRSLRLERLLLLVLEMIMMVVWAGICIIRVGI